eukprot:5734063-Alexandrium_andersonii.AAC.1
MAARPVPPEAARARRPRAPPRGTRAKTKSALLAAEDVPSPAGEAPGATARGSADEGVEGAPIPARRARRR